MNYVHTIIMMVYLVSLSVSSSSGWSEECNLPKDEGEMGVMLGYRLYYNRTTDRCHPFVYKGAGGNENRFLTDMECMRHCSTLGEKLYPDDERVCLIEKDPGHCKASYTMWYFDSLEKKCLKFIYGGCVGNGNRFLTRRECYQRCAPESADNGLFWDEDEEINIGLIVGIIVGCVSIIVLLVTLTLVFLKKKQKKEKRHGKGKETQQLNVELT
ncbi:inter-alpha-trypsin inhibitor-like isoform X1 [Antechinus flavipes]|uniref:inter-alpha-trypsin inhibitor-like isoform X1 n=2 Tax=Antechinus flavipes TaxID=38775 RepID=UPI002235E385|nr:inter-alpha-trypsin inhibitor-like isoform X1 [Antechinus flavipes]